MNSPGTYESTHTVTENCFGTINVSSNSGNTYAVISVSAVINDEKTIQNGNTYALNKGDIIKLSVVLKHMDYYGTPIPSKEPFSGTATAKLTINEPITIS